MKVTECLKSGKLIFLVVFLIFSFFAKSNPIDLNETAHLYEDSITTSLKNAELEKATMYANLYFEFIKKDYSDLTYLAAVDLLFNCLKRQQKYADALVLLNNEKKWIKEQGKGDVVVTINYYLGLLFKELNDNENAIQYFIEVKKALENGKQSYFTEEEQSFSRYRVYTDIGIVLVGVDPDKTFEYFTKAKEVAESMSDSILIADCQLNVGWALLEIGNYEEAEIHLDSALVIYDLLGSRSGQASVFLEQGILLDAKLKADEALGFYMKSYRHLFDNDELIHNSYFLKRKTLELLTEWHMAKENLDSALNYAKMNLDFVMEFKDRKEIASVANKIALIYELKGKESEALEYFKLSNKNYEILKFEDARIDVLKKETEHVKEITDLEMERLQSTLEAKNNWIKYVFFILFVIGLVSLLLARGLQGEVLEKVDKIKAKDDIIYKKNRSVVHLSLANQSKNQIIDNLKERLQSIYKDSNLKSPELKKLIFTLKNAVNTDEEWERFRTHFMEFDPVFYRELEVKWPGLTNLDIRHCALIKLKMTNAEAATILGVSPKSIQMARYRLKKKMNFESQNSLKRYLVSL